MDNFKHVDPVELGENQSLDWERFTQDFSNFLVANELDEKSSKVKAAMLMQLMGRPLKQELKKWKLPEETTTDVKRLMDEIKTRLVPTSNPTYAAFKFRSRTRQHGEEIDAYIEAKRELAIACKFDERVENEDFTDRMIKDDLVLSIKDPQFQMFVLRESNLTLKKLRDMVKLNEQSSEQVSKIRNGSTYPDGDISAVHAMRQDADFKRRGGYHRERRPSRPRYPSRYNSESAGSTSESPSRSSVRSASSRRSRRCPPHDETREKKFTRAVSCVRCGGHHERLRKSCPARLHICKYCGIQGHFTDVCLKRKQDQDQDSESEPHYPRKPKVHLLEATSPSPTAAYQRVLVENAVKIPFKLDTGSEINTIPYNWIRRVNKQHSITPTTITITAYGGGTIKPLGRITLSCTANGKKYPIDFVVMPEMLVPIFGLQACLLFEIITIAPQCTLDSISSSEFPASKDEFQLRFHDVFEGQGKFPDRVTLLLDKTVPARVFPPRRVAKAVRDRLHPHLEHLVSTGIIEKEPQPKSWVSNILVREKPDGSVRMCLDPKPLNTAIRRPYVEIPTIQEIVNNVSKHSVYTVIDLKQGFYQCELDAESSAACCFSTPFGIYKFLRLPFGIVSSPEIFQSAVAKIFGGIPGVHIYYDDLLISGKTVEAHDKALQTVIKRARTNNVKFNLGKLQYRCGKVQYLGHQLQAGSRSIPPQRTEAIAKLPPPTSKKDLQRIIGMVNYVREYLPNVAEDLSVFGPLLRKNVDFIWLPKHQEALDRIKTSIINSTVLAPWDEHAPIALHTDASNSGLGCCVIQNNRVVSFASRTLTESEKLMPPIEKETLAVVFACLKNHYFIYGKVATVVTDHKPLVSLFERPLSQINSPRLLRLIIKVSIYNLKVVYKPGRLMYIPDALSRAPIQSEREKDLELDKVIHSLSIDQLSKSVEQVIQEATSNDLGLSKVKEFILNGWPSRKKLVEPDLHVFFNIRNELKIINGCLYKAHRLIVPKTCQTNYLKQLHTGHLALEKCKANARQSVYWPSLNKDLEFYILNCEVCAKHQKSKSRLSFTPHELPNRPFVKVGLDIFESQGKSYLIMVDYFTKWFEVKSLKGKSADVVISVLKQIFSAYGIPEQVIADNNPFNSAQFLKFSDDWDFVLTTSSPNYPQSNGLCERFIQTVKGVMKKCQEDNSDLDYALLQYRTTPLKSVNVSPAELVFQRQIRTKLPVTENRLEKCQVDYDVVHDALTTRQKIVSNAKNKNSVKRVRFNLDDTVYVQNSHSKLWSPAKIISKAQEPQSYNVVTKQGSVLRRTEKHIKLTPIKHNFEPQIQAPQSWFNQYLQNSESENSNVSPVLIQEQITVPNVLLTGNQNDDDEAVQGQSHSGEPGNQSEASESSDETDEETTIEQQGTISKPEERQNQNHRKKRRSRASKRRAKEFFKTLL